MTLCLLFWKPESPQLIDPIRTNNVPIDIELLRHDEVPAEWDLLNLPYTIVSFRFFVVKSKLPTPLAIDIQLIVFVGVCPQSVRFTVELRRWNIFI
jgi:hypothetical protein